MAVGGIRFGSSTASFSEMISKPQAYVRTEVPNASTSIHAGKPKKKSKLVPILVGAAALAAGVAIGSKNKIFTDGKLAERLKNCELAKKLLSGLDLVGSKINDYAGRALNWVKGKLPKAAEAAQEGVEQLSSMVSKA